MKCLRCKHPVHGFGKGGVHCFACARALTFRPWKVAR